MRRLTEKPGVVSVYRAFLAGPSTFGYTPCENRGGLYEGRGVMAKQRHTPEQIIARLREVEVKTAKGTAIARACKDIGFTEPTYYRWRKEYGGLKTDQAQRLEELEREDARLKRLRAEAEWGKAILRESASGKY
jgi:hypothetical protein